MKRFSALPTTGGTGWPPESKRVESAGGDKRSQIRSDRENGRAGVGRPLEAASSAATPLGSHPGPAGPLVPSSSTSSEARKREASMARFISRQSRGSVAVQQIFSLCRGCRCEFDVIGFRAGKTLVAMERGGPESSALRKGGWWLSLLPRRFGRPVASPLHLRNRCHLQFRSRRRLRQRFRHWNSIPDGPVVCFHLCFRRPVGSRKVQLWRRTLRRR